MTRAMEARAQVILDGWGGSLKFGYQFHRYKLVRSELYSRTRLFRHRLICIIHHFPSVPAESISFVYISVRQFT